MIRSLGSQNYILRYTSEKTVATLDVFTSCVFDGWFIHGCRFEQDASVLDDLYLDRRGTAFNIGWYFIVNTQCNSVKCEFISNVIAMHDAGTLHKACLCQSVFVLFVFLIVLNVPGKTENFSLFCFLFRAINAVYRIHTRLATQADWNLSRYPRGTTSCHTVRSYACAFITWFKVNLL